jgi:shikimate dehydrogenase
MMLAPETEARVPIDTASLRPGLIISRVILKPLFANLVSEAQDRGCIVLDGLGMLVSQAIIGIRLRTRRDPRPEEKRWALEDVFAT